MQISVISPTFYPATFYGGPIFSSYYLAKALAEMDVSITVVTSNANGKKNLEYPVGKKQTLENNLDVYYYKETLKDKFSFQLVRKLPGHIKHADIIYLIYTFSYTTPLTILLSTFYKKPVIFSPRGSLGKWALGQGSQFKKIWLALFIKPFLKNIIFHATAEQEKDEIKDLFPTANIEVIPNGINLEEFNFPAILSKTDFVKKFANKSGAYSPIIVSMSRIHPKKGFDILIRAFYEIIKEFPSAMLCIAGQDFGEQKKLEDLIISLNLTNSVSFTGELSGKDKVDFLTNADIFALPSHNENFGLVYAEALAAGTPVIASKNTPWKELETYNCGRWVDNTVETIHEAIRELLLRNDLPTMGLNGKKMIYELYTWEQIAISFKELLLKLNKLNQQTAKPL